MVRLLQGAARSSLDSDDSMSQPAHAHANNGAIGHRHPHPHHKHQQHQQHADPQQQHTLVLLQSSPHSSAKQYSDYASLDAALDSVVAAFEVQLPSRAQHLQYDIAQLFAYVDRLPDLAVLVFAPHLAAYEPHSKEWVKSAIYEHLKRQAAGQ